MPLAVWLVAYAFVVALSIIFIGKPSLILGHLSLKSLFQLFLDWRFLLGGLLALTARFMFVIINNIAANTPGLAKAHLSISALATTGSLIVIVLINQLWLHEQLTPLQLGGAIIVIGGIILIMK